MQLSIFRDIDCTHPPALPRTLALSPYFRCLYSLRSVVELVYSSFSLFFFCFSFALLETMARNSIVGEFPSVLSVTRASRLANWHRTALYCRSCSSNSRGRPRGPFDVHSGYFPVIVCSTLRTLCSMVIGRRTSDERPRFFGRAAITARLPRDIVQVMSVALFLHNKKITMKRKTKIF